MSSHFSTDLSIVKECDQSNPLNQTVYDPPMFYISDDILI